MLSMLFCHIDLLFNYSAVCSCGTWMIIVLSSRLLLSSAQFHVKWFRYKWNHLDSQGFFHYEIMYCRSVLMWHFSRDVNKTAEFLLYINSQVQSEPNCCEQTDLTPSFCKHTRQVSRWQCVWEIARPGVCWVGKHDDPWCLSSHGR